PGPARAAPGRRATGGRRPTGRPGRRWHLLCSQRGRQPERAPRPPARRSPPARRRAARLLLASDPVRRRGRGRRRSRQAPRRPALKRVVTGTVPRVVIRAARASDVPRLAALLAAGTLRGGEDPTDLAAYLSALDEINSTAGIEVLVAET